MCVPLNCYRNSCVVHATLTANFMYNRMNHSIAAPYTKSQFQRVRNSINFVCVCECVTAFVIVVSAAADAVAAFVLPLKSIKRHFITHRLVSYTIAFIVCTLKVVCLCLSFAVCFFFILFEHLLQVFAVLETAMKN